MTYLSSASGAFGATNEIYPKRIEGEEVVSEWRRCVHCKRRYLWLASWPNELCPRCHRLMEAARADDTERFCADGEPLDVQETEDGQRYLPGCGPLQGRLL